MVPFAFSHESDEVNHDFVDYVACHKDVIDDLACIRNTEDGSVQLCAPTVAGTTQARQAAFVVVSVQ